MTSQPAANASDASVFQNFAEFVLFGTRIAADDPHSKQNAVEKLSFSRDTTGTSGVAEEMPSSNLSAIIEVETKMTDTETEEEEAMAPPKQAASEAEEEGVAPTLSEVEAMQRNSSNTSAAKPEQELKPAKKAGKKGKKKAAGKKGKKKASKKAEADKNTAPVVEEVMNEIAPTKSNVSAKSSKSHASAKSSKSNASAKSNHQEEQVKAPPTFISPVDLNSKTDSELKAPPTLISPVNLNSKTDSELLEEAPPRAGDLDIIGEVDMKRGASETSTLEINNTLEGKRERRRSLRSFFNQTSDLTAHSAYSSATDAENYIELINEESSISNVIKSTWKHARQSFTEQLWRKDKKIKPKKKMIQITPEEEECIRGMHERDNMIKRATAAQQRQALEEQKMKGKNRLFKIFQTHGQVAPTLDDGLMVPAH